VISWLGAYFVKNELYEKAMQFFERAAQIQPAEVKWKLMVASCHRRIQNFQQALQIYQDIHEEYPENVECLRYLVHICGEQGMKEQAHEYVLELRKAEKAAEIENARKEREEHERQQLEQEQRQEMPQVSHSQSPRLSARNTQHVAHDEDPPVSSPVAANSPVQARSPVREPPAKLNTTEDEWGDDDDVAGLLA